MNATKSLATTFASTPPEVILVPVGKLGPARRIRVLIY